MFNYRRIERTYNIVAVALAAVLFAFGAVMLLTGHAKALALVYTVLMVLFAVAGVINDRYRARLLRNMKK